MNKKISTLILALGVLLIFACQKNDQKVTGDTNKLVFFDIKSFFEEEAKILANKKYKIEKTALLNGKKEVKTFDNVDFEAELKIFRDADLNKPSWRDKYKIDSITNKNGQLNVVYNSTNERMKIKKMDLLFQDEKAKQPVEVQIVSQISNPLYETNEHLWYRTNQAYKISSVQKVTLLSIDSIYIEARFLDE